MQLNKFLLKFQEPLLSTTSTSTKGGISSSNPSMVVQHQPSGLIHLGPGISPTCPRHGRTAQMLLAASAANRSGMVVAGESFFYFTNKILILLYSFNKF